MPNVCLTIGTTAPASRVLGMINSIEGLRQWWTPQTTGSTEVGGVLEFRFDAPGPDMKVLESNNNRVVWECIGGPEEWIGTTVAFDVTEADDQTHLMFKHANWPNESPFFYHCSTKWAVFLLSLRSCLETGKGMPFPDDIQITAG